MAYELMLLADPAPNREAVLGALRADRGAPGPGAGDPLLAGDGSGRRAGERRDEGPRRVRPPRGPARGRGAAWRRSRGGRWRWRSRCACGWKTCSGAMRSPRTACRGCGNSGARRPSLPTARRVGGTRRGPAPVVAVLDMAQFGRRYSGRDRRAEFPLPPAGPAGRGGRGDPRAPGGPSPRVHAGGPRSGDQQPLTLPDHGAQHGAAAQAPPGTGPGRRRHAR